jgi:hypothetical protein
MCSLVRVALVSTGLPTPFAGLVDDAAIFPPGNVPLTEAVAVFVDRAREWYADLVGSFVISDVRLPDLLEIVDEHDPQDRLPTTVVVSGGAGSVVPAVTWATGSGLLDLRGVEIALRDPDDLAGNARRVAAAVDEARADGVLGDEVPVFVELPQVDTTASWLAAADVVAEHEFRLKFRTGGVEGHLFPDAPALARWIDAALDRETPFKCTAGLHNAVRHTGETWFEHHGFLNVLLATGHAFDGGSTQDVTGLLEERDGPELVSMADEDELVRARRWFLSFGSCSVLEPLEDLVDLGLVSP